MVQTPAKSNEILPQSSSNEQLKHICICISVKSIAVSRQSQERTLVKMMEDSFLLIFTEREYHDPDKCSQHPHIAEENEVQRR